MPGAIVNSYYAFDDSGASSGTVAVAVTNSITATNLLDAFVRFSDAGGTTITVSGVNDGTAYTADALGKKSNAGDNQSQQNWYLKNHASGTPTVTATFSASVQFYGIRVLEISGLDTTAPEDKVAGQGQIGPGTGADLVRSGATATTAQANEFLLGLSQDTTSGDPPAGTLTAGASYTKNGTNNHTVVESRSVSATGAYEATFTQSANDNRITQIITFKEATGGSTPTTGQVVRATGPGNTPMAAGGGERFRPFVQGVPAAAVIPRGWPGIGKDQQIHPGSGPGNRPFPNFRQGIPAAAVIPQANPGTVQITAMHPGRGPGARQFPDFRQGIAPPAAASAASVDATPGTWTWAGVDATTSQLIYSDGGATAWTWAGTTATTSQLTNATPGTWSWVGLDATTSQLVNASPGAWTWAGTTASTSQLVSATPAAYTWAGVDAGTTQLVNADAGTWSWAGTTATFGGALDATPGTWTWIGTTAEIPTLIGAGIGVWSWSGTTATIPSGVGGGGKPKRHQIRVGKQILEGSKEQIEAIAREIALREQDSAPEVVEIVVPSKRNKPALTAKTQLAADVLAAYSKAVADEVARQLEQDDEEALIALLT